MLSKKDQTDADAVQMLLGLSQSPKMHSATRQSAINLLIQIMHNINHKGEKSHREVRTNAAKALHNIVKSTEKTREAKYELHVLKVLEKMRVHCDAIFEFVHSILSGQKFEHKSLQNACDTIQSVEKLYIYSYENNKCQHAVLALGGLEVTAELLVVNFCLMASQKMADEKPVCHSTEIIAFAISTLVNLTYDDFQIKSILCMFPGLLNALMYHLELKQETIIASGAQLICNLSWKATADIKDSLLNCDASVVLIEALQHVKCELTIQNITKALWNLSGHSKKNKICIIQTGLKCLVELLSYNSPCIVQNAGGILKNVSDDIREEEKYREIFRRSGGLRKLVHHLKSKNKTMLVNATGILWNLSATFPEDQKMLWDLGCVPLLELLRTSHHKKIAKCAHGALHYLLAFERAYIWTSESEQTASSSVGSSVLDSNRDEQYTKMEQNHPKLKRGASVTEVELHQKPRKWRSYMLGPHIPSSKQSLSMPTQEFSGDVVTDARGKKTSRAYQERLHRSLSQSESYYLSPTSISETLSETASTPSDISNEPRHAPSLLPYPFDPQDMEGFDPSTLAYEDNEETKVTKVTV